MFVGENSRREILHEEFHPWGTSAYRSGDSAYDVSPRRYRYTGKERDEETGLDHHGLRYRVPWLGRWSVADPMGMVDGPNLYAYALNNPIAMSDPNGGESIGSGPGIGEKGTVKGQFPQTTNAPGPAPSPAKDPSTPAAPPGPNPGPATAPAVPQAPSHDVGKHAFETTQPSPAPTPAPAAAAEPAPSDTRTTDEALTQGLFRGALGFGSVGELADAASTPEFWFGFATAQPVQILPNLAIGIGKGIVKLTDEELTVEQRAEAGGEAIGSAVSLGALLLPGLKLKLPARLQGLRKLFDAEFDFGPDLGMGAASKAPAVGGPPPSFIGGPGGSLIATGLSPAELLMPGGARIGQAGASASVRVLQGGSTEARMMFEQLATGGTPYAGTYAGSAVTLPGGGFVGLRSVATGTGARAAPAMTIDVRIPGIAIRELKFVP